MTASPSQRRIVISGIGLISPLGNTPQSLWNSLAEGQSGVRTYEKMRLCSGGPRFAALADDFSGKIDGFGELEKDQKKMIRKGLKLMSRETKMGVAAAQLALQDAGFRLSVAVVFSGPTICSRCQKILWMEFALVNLPSRPSWKTMLDSSSANGDKKACRR